MKAFPDAVEVRDHRGCTPLQIALENGTDEQVFINIYKALSTITVHRPI